MTPTPPAPHEPTPEGQPSGAPETPADAPAGTIHDTSRPTVPPHAVSPGAGPHAWEAPDGIPAAGRPTLPTQWGSPLPALLAALGALFAGYVLSLLLILLAWGGLSLTSDQGTTVSDATDQLDLRGAAHGVGALLSLAVHVMDMALGSRFVVSVRGADTVAINAAHATVTLPALVLSAAYVLMAYGAARLAARRMGVGTRTGTAAMAAIAALAAAIVATMLGRLSAFGATTDGVRVLGHSATVAGFFGTLVLAFVPVWAGLNNGVGRHALGEHPLARESVRAMRTFSGHLVALGGLVVVVGALYAFVATCFSDGLGKAIGILLLIPLFIGNSIAWAFGLANFARITGGVSTSLTSHHLGASVSMFSSHWWVAVLMILACLVAIITSGAYWASRRRVGRVSQQAEVFSWVVLPLTYLAGGLLLLLVARVSAAGSLLSDNDTGGVGLAVHLSGWTPLVLMLIGLLVELAARYLASTVIAILPVSLGRFLPAASGADAVLSEHAVHRDGQDAGATGVQGPVVPAAGIGEAQAHMHRPGAAPWSRDGDEPTMLDLQTATEPTQQIREGSSGVGAGASAMATRSPMSAQSRRRLRRLLIGVGSLVALLVLFAIAVAVLNATVFTAKHKAQDVLGKVAAGDASGAVAAMGPAAPQGSQALLASGLYKNTAHRVSDYAITSDTTDGGQATVHAKTRQDTGVSDIDLQLTRHGHRFGLFNNWQVTSMPMGRVALEVPNGVQKVTINGTDIDLRDLSSDSDATYLPALPGSYTVKVPDQGKYFTGSQADVPVSWSDNDEPTQLSVSLNDQFTKDLNAAVKAKVDACAKVQSATVDSSCPWSGPYWDDSSMLTPGWKIDSYPSFSVQSGAEPDGAGRYYVTADHPGQVELTYSEKDTSGAITKGTPIPETMDVSAYATIQNDQVQVSFS